MKKFKKILALALSLAMMLGMSVTTFAENGKREPDDKAEVKITGIESFTNAEGNTVYPTVTLYRIAKGDYDANDFKGFIWATGVNPKVNEGTTVIDIADVAKKLVANPAGITPFTGAESGIVTAGAVVNGTFTATVNAGAYIAVITGGGEAIYNPVLLTATYGATDNDLDGGEVDTGDTYASLFGSTAVTKISKPNIDKEITSNTKDDDGKKTATVGDTITYRITPTMPSYPTGAANRTAFIEDNMSEGLTFNYESLKIKIGTAEVPMTKATVAGKPDTFVYNGEVIANAAKVGNGFRLVFLYEVLADETTGLVPDMTVEYTATLNGKAVVGGEGNTNDAKLVYTTNPNKGSSYEDPTTPPPTDPEYKDKDVEKSEKNTVYTYQLAFKKVDATTNNALPGAVFEIYAKGTAHTDTDPGSVEGTPIDTVTTDANGYAVSTKVEAGKYYIKEKTAPAGYSLNQNVYEIEASWATATTTATMKQESYTTDPEGNGPQVGWLANDRFYALDAVDIPTTGAEAAYLVKSSVQIDTVTTSNAGAGTALLNTNITNTKPSSLPSTGGIGTTIFTIGGCAIMILAAALYFASRRKTAK